MQQKGLLSLGAVTLLALAMACGGDKKSANPTSPSASTTTTSASDTSDTATLKVDGPTPTDPTGGERLDSMTVVVKFAAASGKYVQGANFTYRVQVLNAAGTVLETQTGTALSYTLTADLEANTTYTWRVRAELDGHVGAWQTATFKTMEQPTGYIKATEIYDPLTNGKSVGKIIGSYTWMGAQGIRLNARTSYIEYTLPQTLTAGEFSALISNLNTDEAEIKYKVLSMRQGDYDMTTNPYRFTVEKRGNGIVAWRIITSSDQADTVGSERVKRAFHESLTYFWKATWGGAFRLEIRENGYSGTTIYNFGKSYGGTYRPSPHRIYAGTPDSRSGSLTCPGMIIRQIWVSGDPRPTWANK